MNELFGGVVYAGIDTDKHRYPIGKYHFDESPKRQETNCGVLGGGHLIY